MCNHDWIACGDEKMCWLCGQVVKADEPAPSVTELIFRQKNRPITQVLHGNSLEVLKTQESVICGKENVQGIDKFINQIIHGDCLEVMKDIPDGSVDMILCDLPYGTTACKWDTVIPFEPLWEQYERVIKNNGAIVLTANQPFTSALVMSNTKLFRYEWIWKKTRPTGFPMSRYRPMKKHETIVVFSKCPATYTSGETMQYFPQGVKECERVIKRTTKHGTTTNGGELGSEVISKFTGFPNTILEVNNTNRDSKLHPTQKPVALFEYLIKTYTNEGEIVLDNCIGSGTTAVAALNTGRFFIGIELDEQYVEIARRRINAVGE